MKPYTDDLMRWDDATGRYYLTETALIRQGIDLRSRLGRSASPEYVINGLLNRTTALVYGYIHGHNINTQKQDALIAETPSMRDIIYNALLAQAVYVVYNGDLSISVKPEERENYMDITARTELARIMPEYGRNILYSGVI